MTIKKDYGNSCLNHCVLRLHSNKIIQFQSSMLKVMLFSARFSLIMVTFVLSELPQNRTMNKRGTRRYTQGLNINDLNFPKLFGQMTKIHSYRLKCNALDCQECEHSASANKHSAWDRWIGLQVSFWSHLRNVSACLKSWLHLYPNSSERQTLLPIYTILNFPIPLS